MNFKRYLLVLTIVSFVIGIASHVNAASYVYTTIDVPGSPSTICEDINSAGQIVGTAGGGTSGQAGCGFFFDGVTFSQVCYPDAKVSGAYGINDRNEIVGSHNSLGLGSQGYYYAYRPFLLSSGVYTSFAHPCQCQSFAEGFNNNGKVVGRYLTGGREQGFLFDGTNFTSIVLPGDPNHVPQDINNNDQVVGIYWDGTGKHGYIFNLSDGFFKTIDYPGSVGVYVTAVNDGGEIAGAYWDSNRGYGYYSKDGINFITIDYPGSTNTVAYGLNNNGQIVGLYHATPVM